MRDIGPEHVREDRALELVRLLDSLASGRAIALGATIAFGSCGLAACAVDTVDEMKMPALGGIAPEIVDEPEADAMATPVPEGPDLEARDAVLGAVDLAPGFTPDPTTQSGTTRGGPFDARMHDERCEGWIARQPDAMLRAHRPFAELAIVAVARAETTLMVVGPDGDARCASGGDDESPVLRASFERGVHRVWVGTLRRGEQARYVLALTELEDTDPAALLH